MSTLERIYFFHTRIQAGRYPNTSSLVREFEISPATAHRDVAYLRDRLLAPLAFDRRRNGYYYTDTPFHLPFENSPSLVLLLGLLGSMARQSGLAGLTELDDLKDRIQGLVFPGQRDLHDLLYCEWIEMEEVDRRVFRDVLDSLRQQRRMTFRYRSGTGDTSERTVDPLKLVSYQGRWYLLGWCHLRRERRLFHLGRVSATALLAETADHGLARDDDWLTASFGIFKGPPRYRVTIRFTGKAARLVRHQFWHAEQEMHTEGDDIIMTLPVADDREIMMKVLQFGADARVLAPAELRHRLAAETRRMAALYGK
ncbi:MAG TPA: WYL domain-containing protein [Desulfobulbus sp.]|nr:WYL domain-containing protein [Desulfobulbus sp.]